MICLKNSISLNYALILSFLLIFGYAFVGLSRPIYASFYIPIFSAFLVICVIAKRVFASTSRDKLKKSQMHGTTSELRLAVFLYSVFLLVLIWQIFAQIFGILITGGLRHVGFVGYNLDVSILVAIFNMILIFAGFHFLSSQYVFAQFLRYYFLMLTLFWHLSFLTWNIEDNAALFYYSEWARGYFSGALINANHASFISLLCFCYFSISAASNYQIRKTVEKQNFSKSWYVFCLFQIAIFTYYIVIANSLTVYLLFLFAIVMIGIWITRFFKFKYVLIYIVIFCVVSLLLYSFVVIFYDFEAIKDVSFKDRQIILIEAVRLVLERILFGYGTGSQYLALLQRSPDAIPEFVFLSSHNYIVDFGIQYGGIGLFVALVGLFVLPLRILYIKSKKNDADRELVLFIFLTIVLTFLFSLVEFIFFIPAFSMFVCFLIGGLYRLHEKTRIQSKF